jgi:hypothetical protein
MPTRSGPGVILVRGCAVGNPQSLAGPPCGTVAQDAASRSRLGLFGVQVAGSLAASRRVLQPAAGQAGCAECIDEHAVESRNLAGNTSHGPGPVIGFCTGRIDRAHSARGVSCSIGSP